MKQETAKWQPESIRTLTLNGMEVLVGHDDYRFYTLNTKDLEWESCLEHKIDCNVHSDALAEYLWSHALPVPLAIATLSRPEAKDMLKDDDKLQWWIVSISISDVMYADADKLSRKAYYWNLETKTFCKRLPVLLERRVTKTRVQEVVLNMLPEIKGIENNLEIRKVSENK